MKNNSIFTKSFGVHYESMKLPTGKSLNYKCFRSNVKLDVLVYLCRDKNMILWLDDEDVNFKPSFQNVKGEFRPRVQVCAAFPDVFTDTGEEEAFSLFETAFMKAMASAETNRVKNKRSGGSFLVKHLATYHNSTAMEFQNARNMLEESGSSRGFYKDKRTTDILNSIEEHVKGRQECYDREPINMIQES